MKNCVYSNSLNCENKDKFQLAKTSDLQGIILDISHNNLRELPSRNYYIMQSVKTEIAIPAISMSIFTTRDFFDATNLEEAKLLIDEGVLLADKMKVSTLLIPCEGESQIDTEEDLRIAGMVLKYAAALGEIHNIKVGIDTKLTDEMRSDLSNHVDSESFLYISDSFDEWTIV